MPKSSPDGIAAGRCLCGGVAFEIDVPARWAWHDHSAVSRSAHGAAYATYVGSWRKRFRVTAGEDLISRYEDATAKTVRSCGRGCGAPRAGGRARSPRGGGGPRARGAARAGRGPRGRGAGERAPDGADT